MKLWQSDGPATKCIAENLAQQKTCDGWMEGVCREDCCNKRERSDWNQCINEKRGEQ